MKPFVVLLLFAASLFAAPIPKSLKKKGLNLNGVWKSESVFVGNINYNSTSLIWTMDGPTMTFERDNTNANKQYGLLLADSDKHRALDWIVTEGTTKHIYLGIDELDGETWKFCANMSPENTTRPTKLEQNKDVYFYTFKRVK